MFCQHEIVHSGLVNAQREDNKGKPASVLAGLPYKRPSSIFQDGTFCRSASSYLPGCILDAIKQQKENSGWLLA